MYSSLGNSFSEYQIHNQIEFLGLKLSTSPRPYAHATPASTQPTNMCITSASTYMICGCVRAYEMSSQRCSRSHRFWNRCNAWDEKAMIRIPMINHPYCPACLHAMKVRARSSYLDLENDIVAEAEHYRWSPMDLKRSLSNLMRARWSKIHAVRNPRPVEKKRTQRGSGVLR